MQRNDVLVVALGGRVLGVDAISGEVIWSNEMELGGIAWVALGVDESRVYSSASAKRIFCIDRATGNTLWDRPTSGLGRATIICDESGISVCKSGLLDKFSIDGDLLWSTDLQQYGKGVAALGLTGNVIQADGRSK